MGFYKLFFNLKEVIIILFFWLFILLVAAWAAHWGADKLLFPLQMLRKQLGLTASAGAALLAVVTASPEIAINVISAVRGVSDIGLGNLLGSNIISIPLIITISYFSSRGEFKNKPEHKKHIQSNFLALNRRSIKVLSLPYLAIVFLVALLTIPENYRGLQPVDGWIMIAAYIIFLFNALKTGRIEGEKVEWNKKRIMLSLAGAAAITTGAFFIVIATENIVNIFGISEIIGGLFITGVFTTIPEIFKTSSVVKGGEVTSGTTSVIADNAITMTIAFFPLALVNTAIKNFQLYWINLLFVGIMPLLYSIFIYQNKEESGFTRIQIIIFDSVYFIYILIILFTILNF